jgi:hypothetical protein
MNLSADSEEGKKRFTTEDLYRLQYTSLSGRWTSLGGTESWFDTVGCNYFKIFATPGSRNSLRTYSRQYENLVASRGIATAI